MPSGAAPAAGAGDDDKRANVAAKAGLGGGLTSVFRVKGGQAQPVKDKRDVELAEAAGSKRAGGAAAAGSTRMFRPRMMVPVSAIAMAIAAKAKEMMIALRN